MARHHSSSVFPVLRSACAASTERRALDVLEDEGQHGVHLDVGEPDPIHHPKLAVVLGYDIGAQRRPARRVDLQHPRVPVIQVPVFARDPLEPGPPSPIRVPGHLAQRRIQHDVHELGLAGHVRVEGHRADPQPVGEALLAVGLLLSLRFSLLWVGIYLGLVAKGPEAVTAVQILV